MKKQTNRIRRLIVTIILSICMPFMVSMPLHLIQASDTAKWDELIDTPLYDVSAFDMYDDIADNFWKQTVETGYLYDDSFESRTEFNSLMKYDASRLMYLRKFMVNVGTEISIVAAKEDTAETGGESIVDGMHFYWTILEFGVDTNGNGHIAYDGDWRTVNQTWKVGVSTNDETAYGGGNNGIPKALSHIANYAQYRHDYVSRFIPVFRWNNGDLALGAGSQTITAKNIQDKFAVFQLVTKPFTYTFNLNGGNTNGSTADKTMERLGISDVTLAFSEPTRTGYTFTGWKITSTEGKQAGKEYTTEELATMLKDGKYYSSLFTDTKFEAQWVENEYTVKYNANGGSGSMSNQPMTYNTAYNLTANTFTRAGYTFRGWATSASGSVVYTDKQSVKNLSSTQGEVINLYAVWSENTYNIDVIVTDAYKYKIEDIAYTASQGIAAPSRTGYTFTGWKVSGINSNTALKYEGSNGWVAISDNSVVEVGSGYSYFTKLTDVNDKTVTFTAQWTPDTYTLTINPNGGTMYNGGDITGNSFTTSFMYGRKSFMGNLTSSGGYYGNTPTKTGYIFTGWSFSNGTGGLNSSGDAVYFGSAANAGFTSSKSIYYFNGDYAGNVTATAQWVANSGTKYKVNHYQMNIGGSGYTLKETETLTGTSGSSVTLKDLAKNYTGFIYQSGKGTTVSSATPSGYDTTTTILADGTRVINLYYSRNRVVVNYNLNGGDAGGDYKGYDIYSDNDEILYDDYYGDVYEYTETYYYGQEYTFGAFNGTNILVNKYAHTLNSWYDGSEGWITGSTAYIHDLVTSCRSTSVSYMTVTLKWTEKSYDISYELNGGTKLSGGNYPTSAKYSDVITISGLADKTGYGFIGWKLTNYSSGAKQSYNNSTWSNVNANTTSYRYFQYLRDNTGTVILYAQYSPNGYTVKYDSNCGMGSIANQSVVYDETFKLATNAFTYQGKTFVGWNTKADGSGTDYAENEEVSNLTSVDGATITLYAKWEASTTTYTIRHWTQNLDGSTYSLKSEYTKEYNNATAGQLLTVSDYALSGTDITGFTYKEGKVNGTTSTTAEVKADGSIVIDLYYTRNQYFLTYNVSHNYGKWNNNDTSERTTKLYYGQNINFSLPAEREGWEFVGWNTSENSQNALTDMKMPAGDIILYALYKKAVTAKFTDCEGTREQKVIIYNRQNESITDVPYVQEYNWENVMSVSIIGWSSERDVNTQQGITAQFMSGQTRVTISEDTHYYAVYNAQACYEYDIDGGISNADTQTKEVIVYVNASDMEKVRGEIITFPGTEKAGYDDNIGYIHAYELKCWQVNDNIYNIGNSLEIKENTVIKAVWNEILTPIKYTIIYDTGLGEHIYPIIVRYDEEVRLPYTADRVGFVFTSWNTLANGSGISFAGGETVKNLTTVNNSTVVLYAGWSQKHFRIIKIASSRYMNTFATRMQNNEKWYNSFGKLGIRQLFDISPEMCIQRWSIKKDGTIMRIK